MKEIRILLMGTPEFAVVPFEAIIKEGYNVIGLVSQPDRPQGRNKEILPTPTKKMAQKYNIPVLAPEKIRTNYEEVAALKPDLIVTCAYGQIIPKALLDVPTIGCINIHASLLPKLRGGAPIHKSIIYGEKETGVTIMDMVEKMDAGDMISQKSTPILDSDTAGSLFEKLSVIGADLILETLPSIIDGSAKRVKQNEELVTYAWNISKDEEKIVWDKSAREVFNQIRGLNPWPIAYTMIGDERVKIHSVTLTDKNANAQAGTIVYENGAMLVATADKFVEIKEIQPFGKSKMDIKSFLNGGTRYEKFND